MAPKMAACLRAVEGGVKRATVVDGRGRIRTVDASHDADLYWALRGGGSGAAIVTSFTYRTISATSMGFFTLSYPASAAATRPGTQASRAASRARSCST